jgi:serine/threonine protein kinase
MVKENEIERNYIYLKQLGAGYHGEVWEAKNTITGEIVAIKIYKNKEKSTQYLKYEENALKYLLTKSKLCKDWAVCYKDAWIDKDKTVLVMEYIDGITVDGLISEKSVFTRRHIFNLLYDLVLGLDKLHKAGITHQDIKEENIKYDYKIKKYRYIDWGAGCIKSYCNTSNIFIRLIYGNICEKPCGYRGAPHISPPEIYLNFLKTGQVYQPQTFNDTRAHDIWSLGVVLYDWFIFGSNNPDKIRHFNNLFKEYYKVGDKYKYLSQYTIKDLHEKIDKTSLTPFIKKVLKSLLDTKNRRLQNWDYLVKQVSRLANGQCNSNEIVVFNSFDNRNYCMTIKELKIYLSKPKKLIEKKSDSLTFVNPYNPNEIITIKERRIISKV